MGKEFWKSACPHDCPSGCALEVERLSSSRIGRIRGAAANDYTDGVVCAKVARYAERVHHPDRLKRPLQRIGEKGSGEFRPISWDAALDEIAGAFAKATEQYGPEAVWPYHSGGTMGVVQRYGIERLRHAFGYSRQHSTICMTPAESGWRAGVGKLTGADPREMAQSDLIVVWGGNPVSTQVNAMTHIAKARKQRQAKLAVIDVYRTPTVEAADIGLVLRPGTDGALALAMMHVLLAEGLADRDYLTQYTDFDADVEAHLADKTPDWAAQLTGLSVDEIVEFARLYGRTPKSFLRLGFGFTRSRNGASAMHAVSCLPAITGAWRYAGGGAFFINWDIWSLDLALAHGLDWVNPATRILDQSRIGPVLCGEPAALAGGPPVTAMLMQNANSANVAPDSGVVARGLSRSDLFLCVHEQFMTATARYADIVLPAAMFLEYDDIYYGFGQTHLSAGPRVLDRYEECRSNHEVVCQLGRRLGANHPSFEMTAVELLDATLRASGKGTWEDLARRGWMDCAQEFEESHFLKGFPTPDGRFHFKPDWAAIGPYHAGMVALPQHCENFERPTAAFPFRLVVPPARTFLNTTFTETSSSVAREGQPRALVNPADADRLGIVEGSLVQVGNDRGQIRVRARIEQTARTGVVIVEGNWPSNAFLDGVGVNVLIGSDAVPPNGGAAFHDTAVWVRSAQER
ncbi:Anaerobic selenocysteine-containing dehydrogenase [Enhydrobacter aerosaccus]|uniref:Anaerobic selenocysteine-containing dehydrogenase n=1 Tax=Enhydrobacter aerosaccus TaxID=225324 RepID=A0A1T4JK67_9HYPH|nr:molybdopterin oxidoreductase family protein [Enhydrobacter aerosaccus]SJZ30546.1 Anaerobic selenocysteine-containing dehydrogenase [Enhydrobacter aerosaccus]